MLAFGALTMLMKLNVLIQTVSMILVLVTASPVPLLWTSRPSRSRKDSEYITGILQHGGNAGFVPPAPPMVPKSLFTLPVDEETLRRYLDLLEVSLKGHGFKHATASPKMMEAHKKVQLAGLLRDQISQGGLDKRQFIYIHATPPLVPEGRKLYGMPLEGKAYANLGAVNYQGVGGKQIVALFTVAPPIPGGDSPSPQFHLHGVARVLGAPKLHAQLPSQAAGMELSHDIVQVVSAAPQAAKQVLEWHAP